MKKNTLADTFKIYKVNCIHAYDWGKSIKFVHEIYVIIWEIEQIEQTMKIVKIINVKNYSFYLNLLDPFQQHVI